MTEALPTNTDTARPAAKQVVANKKFFLGVILVCLIIAIIPACIAFSIRGTDHKGTGKPVQSMDTSTLLIQQGTPAGIQLSIPLSSRRNFHFTPPADAQLKTNITPQSNSTSNLTPTSMAHITTVDDSIRGTGNNQFNYVGGWKHTSNRCQAKPCEYNNSNGWDNTPNDYVTLTFTGTQLRFYGVIDPKHGIGAVSMDGGSETMINFYAAKRAGDQLLWISPTLPVGTHTFKLRVTGTKDSRSSNTYVIVDRVDIIS